MIRFILALTALPVFSVAGYKGQFLKEIVTGRCYDRPPNGREESCPELVGRLMAVLEGNLDGRITSDMFSSYFDSADFSPSPSGGLFWLKGDKDPEDDSIRLPGWKTPETTPGGALMAGLNICGVDLRQDCPKASGASNTFWTSAYSQYASKVKGSLHIVLADDSNLAPLLDGGIDNLSRLAVTSVTIHSQDCGSHAVEVVGNALYDADIKSRDVVCQQGVAPFGLLCEGQEPRECECDKSDVDNDTPSVSGPPIPTSPQPQTQPPPRVGHDGGAYKVLFWVLFLIFAVGCYATSS